MKIIVYTSKTRKRYGIIDFTSSGTELANDLSINYDIVLDQLENRIIDYKPYGLLKILCQI